MSELQSKTCLVWDHGLSVGLAERLARSDGFGRVLYHSPHEEGFSDFSKGIIGYGVGKIERCNDPWKIKNDVDCFVFPDIEHSGVQEELESQGFPVWGSRSGDSLELNRQKFHRVLGRLGLDVPKFVVCKGMDNLKAYLKEHDKDCYIKIDRWRGSWETWHFRSWKLDECELDFKSFKLGRKKELIDFMVFDPIETPLEIGGDTWNIIGQWPSLMLHGDENKDKAYLAVVTKRTDMPPQIQEILEAFGPELKKYRYCNFWSMEDRIKNPHHYFGDATCRGPFPSSASHLEVWKNLPLIIWAGANGELLEPVPEKKYTGEVILNIKCGDECEAAAEIPKELERWVKPADCYRIGGVTSFVAPVSEAGWMCAIGDTIEEVVFKIKEQCDLLPDGMSADLEPLSELITILDKSEEQGIPFGTKPIPSPEIVLDAK